MKIKEICKSCGILLVIILLIFWFIVSMPFKWWKWKISKKRKEQLGVKEEDVINIHDVPQYL